MDKPTLEIQTPGEQLAENPIAQSVGKGIMGLNAAAQGFRDSATMGLSDKVGALVDTLFMTGPEGEAFAAEFERRLAERTSQNEVIAEQFPVFSTIGNVGGFVAGPGKAFGAAEKASTQGLKWVADKLGRKSMPGLKAKRMLDVQDTMKAMGRESVELGVEGLTGTARVATGAIAGAGVGATDSALRGLDPARGALYGSLGGALGPATTEAMAFTSMALGGGLKQLSTLTKIADNTKASKVIIPLLKKHPVLFNKISGYGGLAVLGTALGLDPSTAALLATSTAFGARRVAGLQREFVKAERAALKAQGTAQEAVARERLTAAYNNLDKASKTFTEKSLEKANKATIATIRQYFAQELPDYMKTDAKILLDELEQSARPKPKLNIDKPMLTIIEE